jgi:hypothetical protein
VERPVLRAAGGAQVIGLALFIFALVSSIAALVSYARDVRRELAGDD